MVVVVVGVVVVVVVEPEPEVVVVVAPAEVVVVVAGVVVVSSPPRNKIQHNVHMYIYINLPYLTTGTCVYVNKRRTMLSFSPLPL